MRYIDIQHKNEYRYSGTGDLPSYVLEAPENHPWFGAIADNQTVDWPDGELPIVRDKTSDEILAEEAMRAISNELVFVEQEMYWIDEFIKKKEDGHTRGMPSATIGVLRAYRNALRDHIIDNVVQGQRPSRPA